MVTTRWFKMFPFFCVEKKKRWRDKSRNTRANDYATTRGEGIYIYSTQHAVCSSAACVCCVIVDVSAASGWLQKGEDAGNPRCDEGREGYGVFAFRHSEYDTEWGGSDFGRCTAVGERAAGIDLWNRFSVINSFTRSSSAGWVVGSEVRKTAPTVGWLLAYEKQKKKRLPPIWFCLFSVLRDAAMWCECWKEPGNGGVRLGGIITAECMRLDGVYTYIYIYFLICFNLWWALCENGMEREALRDGRTSPLSFYSRSLSYRKAKRRVSFHFSLVQTMHAIVFAILSSTKWRKKPQRLYTTYSTYNYIQYFGRL